MSASQSTGNKNAGYVFNGPGISTFWQKHRGEKIVVCGCGMSLHEFKEHHQKFITIGINDVPGLFDPTYLLASDAPGRFLNGRRELLEKSSAKHFFTFTKGWNHPSVVEMKLGVREIKNLDSQEVFDHCYTSAFVGVELAYKMGAKKIGLIGVDFTEGHFYAPNDGPHISVKTKNFERINHGFAKLCIHLKSRGVAIYNLSAQSKLTPLTKISLKEFEDL
jgi:hypothetical protein